VSVHIPLVEEINLGEITLTRYFMLYMEEYYTAVMADFHLGYEDVMAQKGLFLPRLQYPYIRDLLEKIVEKYEPRRFIIDGDLKHEFSKNMPQEWREIEDIVDLRFQYYGFDPQSQTYNWFDSWNGEELLAIPLAIRIDYDEKHLLVPINASFTGGQFRQGMQRFIQGR